MKGLFIKILIEHFDEIQLMDYIAKLSWPDNFRALGTERSCSLLFQFSFSLLSFGKMLKLGAHRILSFLMPRSVS